MVSAVDAAVANTTIALDARGMLSNTLLFFTADNGGPIDATVGGDAIGSSNWPLRGGKHSIWEGGVRAVAFAWGGKDTALSKALAGGAAPRLYQNLFDIADYFPTILDAVGGAAAGGAAAGAVVGGAATVAPDGVSHWAALLDASVASPRNSTFIGHWDDPLGGHGVRSDEGGRRWKLLRGNVAVDSGDNTPFWFASDACVPGVNASNDRPCCCDGSGPAPPARAASADAGPAAAPARNADAVLLFDLATDVGERTDVSSTFPDVAQRLGDMADAWLATAVPEGPPPDPSCPAKAFANDSAVGDAWQSWCSV